MDLAQIETLLTWASIALITAGVGGVALVLLRNLQAASRRRTRLSGDLTVAPAGGGAGMAGDALGEAAAAVKRLGDKLALQDPASVNQIKAKLIHAGFYGREAVGMYMGARAISLVLATVAVVLLLPWAIAGGGGMLALCMASILAGVGIMGPDQLLQARTRARQIEYREGFPDLLDLLVASVEAGLSLDAAIGRVTEELTRRYPNMSVHLRVLTLELRAGRARKDAWGGLAERLGIDEAHSLATMLRQAEEMGTSLGETLAVFSDDMRAKRMLKAEEKAMALPAKMMIPLILFIFPCLMGVLILPAAFNISRTFAGH